MNALPDIRQAGIADRISRLASAGGAFLEWLEGRALAGIAIPRRTTRQPEDA